VSQRRRGKEGWVNHLEVVIEGFVFVEDKFIFE
jgi:hypothetical protein